MEDVTFLEIKFLDDWRNILVPVLGWRVSQELTLEAHGLSLLLFW